MSATPAPTRISLGVTNAGERLDRFLAAQVGLSRADVRRLLADGCVTLDGRACGYRDKGLILTGSGVVELAERRVARELQVRAPERADMTHADATSIRVLAEGPGWIAVDKPAGAPVHPLREDETGAVLNAVAVLHPEIQGVGDEGGLRSGVVHRLDVETSGVLLLATTAPAWRRLRQAFREHRVEKIYRALVVGHPGETLAPADGTFGPEREYELIVARHRPARVRVIEGSRDSLTRRRGYPARQRLRVVERFERTSLVEVEIATGFLHQIRVIAAHLGHPVLGDALYGDEAALAEGAARQQLHAARLLFEEIAVESPDPADLSAMISRLRRGVAAC